MQYVYISLLQLQTLFNGLVHLVGFIIRIYHDTRSPERQTRNVF